jgi:hypothetical protein
MGLTRGVMTGVGGSLSGLQNRQFKDMLVCFSTGKFILRVICPFYSCMEFILGTTTPDFSNRVSAMTGFSKQSFDKLNHLVGAELQTELTFCPQIFDVDQ